MTIFESADAKLLPGFRRERIDVDGNAIMTLRGGSGPPLLMLHGDPQTHLCRHLIAPRLTDRFTIVLTDLRGRGESHKPPVSIDHSAYSKREMAAEQVAVMRALGYEKFSVVGHDRGARVSRRLALDNADAVEQLVIMDIIPALNFYEAMNAEIAQDYFYFSFLTQDYPIPDRLVQNDAEAFMRLVLLGLSDKPVAYAGTALDAYLAASTTPAAVNAMCECFRAGFHIDRHHDVHDRKSGNKIACPTLVMWGENGVVGRHFDVKAVWNEWCTDVSYASMSSGHFIPEEASDDAFIALNHFLRSV